MLFSFLFTRSCINKLIAIVLINYIINLFLPFISLLGFSY